MKNKSTQLTIAIGLSVLSLASWKLTGLVSTSRMIASQIFIIGSYAAFRVIQGNQFNRIKNKVAEENKASTLSRSELRKVIDRWADRELKKHVEVDWNFADQNAKPIYENGEKVDEYICVTGAASTVTLQVFVLASEKEVKENNTVRANDMYLNPFRYSEYWQEVKRQNRFRTVDDGDRQRINFIPGAMAEPSQNRVREDSQGE